jgi:hypothetical protein
MHQQQMADIVSQDNSIAKHRFVMVEDSTVHNVTVEDGTVHNVTVEDDSCTSISFGVRAAVISILRITLSNVLKVIPSSSSLLTYFSSELSNLHSDELITRDKGRYQVIVINSSSL